MMAIVDQSFRDSHERDLAPRTLHLSVLRARTFISLLALEFALVASSTGCATPPPLVFARLNVRVDRPLISRGPVTGELDNTFNETVTNDGKFRGYSGGSDYTLAIVGDDPWSMFAAGVKVLPPGGKPPQPGTPYECGMWMEDTEKLPNGVIHGFVHMEMGCNQSHYTHKSMGLASSYDDGQSWLYLGQIISGADPLQTSRTTGEGDCTVVNSGDGLYYAYCLRVSDWRTIVARAPISAPQPGNWRKFNLGSWTTDALLGDATSLGFIGTSSARWTTYNQIVLLAINPPLGGVKTYLSSDRTTFTELREPLLTLDADAGNWNRNPPPSTELITYISLMNSSDGNNQIGDRFLITYSYIQPDEGFNNIYLVTRDVTMWVSTNDVTEHVGVALSRWYNAAGKDRWSTTAAVPGNYSSYKFEGTAGYLMTAAPTEVPIGESSPRAARKLEDCVGPGPGPNRLHHILTWDGTCEGTLYTRLRTAGWVYSAPQPNTVPLYCCYDAKLENHFVSNQAGCEGLGKNEALLGYALSNRPTAADLGRGRY
jgi:hypothetical protein